MVGVGISAILVLVVSSGAETIVAPVVMVSISTQHFIIIIIADISEAIEQDADFVISLGHIIIAIIYDLEINVIMDGVGTGDALPIYTAVGLISPTVFR